jgi:NAD-dependent dihydropyrimidine dehydrogenase PreA subunit
MSGIFIDVRASPVAAGDPAIAARLAEVCPVDIFRASATGLEIVTGNLDECVLCDLCLEVAPPGSIEIIRLYSI